jgi:Acetyltransferase (GNAT) domain/Acetyltransferase (GNAT) family
MMLRSGLGDAEAFYAADNDGFFIGELADSTGSATPVACISAVAFDDTYGFIGCYICHPEHRGKGYGLAVWRAAMAYLGERTIGLDAVLAQQANYSTCGFHLQHRNVRYSGSIAAADLPVSSDSHIVALERDTFVKVEEYERPIFGVSRTAFLEKWLDGSSDRTARVYMQDVVVRGYGVIRPSRDGFKIGPLFADTVAVAEALFTAVVKHAAAAEAASTGTSSSAGSVRVHIDCPDVNAEATALAARYGLAPAFECARMYKGTVPSLDLERTFGITCLELG